MPLDNRFLPQLIQTLHEDTIENISKYQTLKMFSSKFLSPSRIEQRVHASKILRSFVENSESRNTELEILGVLESLRLINEDLYKKFFDIRYESTILFDDNLSRSLLDDLQELLYRNYHSPTDFDILIRLGGVYVLLDIFYLDYHFYAHIFTYQTFGSMWGSPFLSENFQWRKLQEVTAQLIERLIYHSDDVKRTILQSQTMLYRLAETYRRCADRLFDAGSHTNVSIRNSIANSFLTLAKFKDGGSEEEHRLNYPGNKIIQYLTENAVILHSSPNQKNDAELLVILEFVSVLTERNRDCRVDFLRVLGAMDLLVDLFDVRRPFDWSWKIAHMIHSLKSAMKPGKGTDILSYMMLRPSTTILKKIFKFFLRNFGLNYYYAKYALVFRWIIYLAQETFLPPKALHLAGDIMKNIAPNIHDNPRVLQEFRQRDACELLSRNLYFWTFRRDITTRALLIIHSFALHKKPEMESERKRLIELEAVEKIEKMRAWLMNIDPSQVALCDEILRFLSE